MCLHVKEAVEKQLSFTYQKLMTTSEHKYEYNLVSVVCNISSYIVQHLAI